MPVTNLSKLPGDNPILELDEDLLRRSDFVENFVQGVVELDTTRGAVVGIFAPWGAGKTSFVNLARKTFEQKGIQVLDFNPWLFSGTEQLVDQFFSELSIEMSSSTLSEKLGEAFEKYGQALSTITSVASTLLAIPQIAAISDGIGKAAVGARQRESINALKGKIEKELKRGQKPLVIVLDDVDRLSTQEIRDVFRLVRLTASFPNLVYIVPCDRHRIEQALDDDPEQRLSGKDYLEKIIQWSFNLPEVPQHLLEEQLLNAIKHAVADIEDIAQLDEEEWEEICDDIIRPLIRNMRDVRRYALAIRQTLRGLNQKVALADVLALEAVRLFMPDIFRLLYGAIDGLTGVPRMLERNSTLATAALDPEHVLEEICKRLKDQVTGLVQAAEKNRNSEESRTAKEVVKSLLFNLFPAGAKLLESEIDLHEAIDRAVVEADEFLGDRRVAHEQVFRLYLEQVESPNLLDFYDAKRALARMNNSEKLEEFIRSLDRKRWPNVISCLSNLWTGDWEQAECGIIVLLNLWPDIPERPSNSGIRIHRNGWNVIRSAIRNLLRAFEGENIRARIAVHNIWPKVTSLSSKSELVLRIGYQQKTGRRLVEEALANKFEEKLLGEIGAATADELAREHRILQVLEHAKQLGSSLQTTFGVPDSPELTLALLRSVRSETITGSTESSAVQRIPALNWERLNDLIGSENELKSRICKLSAFLEDRTYRIEECEISRDEAEHLLSLANRYLSGEQTDES